MRFQDELKKSIKAKGQLREEAAEAVGKLQLPASAQLIHVFSAL